MTAKINIKNGDTFAVQASVSGVTIDNGIDKWQIKSQVRKPKTLELVADLSVNGLINNQKTIMYRVQN